MQQGLLYRFLVRWLVSSLGLWIAAGLTNAITYEGRWQVIVVAGLILALVNALIRPIVVLLSLPAILLTLGLFMIAINALMVLLAAWLYGPLQVDSFWTALLAGIIIGLVNYLVTAILESVRSK